MGNHIWGVSEVYLRIKNYLLLRYTSDSDEIKYSHLFKRYMNQPDTSIQCCPCLHVQYCFSSAMLIVYCSPVKVNRNGSPIGRGPFNDNKP